MKTGDFAVVVSGCCEGHPIGSVVEVVDSLIDVEGFICYQCDPVRNSPFKITLWHCDNCLSKIHEYKNVVAKSIDSEGSTKPEEQV